MPRIEMAVIGVALIIGGTALAVNFKGFATWHVRRSMESVRWLERPLRNIPPWKSFFKEPVEDRIARQVGLLRVIGAAFACAGLLLFVGALVPGNVTTS